MQPLPPAWRAGHYRVLENKENQHPLLAFALEFDTPAHAEEFMNLYEQKVIPAKTKRSGTNSVKQQGTRISVLEGIE